MTSPTRARSHTSFSSPSHVCHRATPQELTSRTRARARASDDLTELSSCVCWEPAVPGIPRSHAVAAGSLSPCGTSRSRVNAPGRRARALREISDALRGLGVPLLYELLVPATSGQLAAAGE
jgi:hypothetical protein